MPDPVHRTTAGPTERPSLSGSLRSGLSRALGAAALLGVCFLLTSPIHLEGQLRYGGHFVRAQESFGGAGGVGVRGGIGLPLFPMEAFASGEYFFPACAGIGGCALAGASLDVNLRLPIAFLSPYATGGWVVRRIDPGGGGEVYSRTGLHLGLGAGAGLPGARLFGEARYELARVPSRQLVIRVGVLLGG